MFIHVCSKTRSTFAVEMYNKLPLQTLRLHFINSLPSIFRPDEMDTLLSHDSVALTLRLLGAPLDPILDRTTELQFLHSSYTHIVQCLKVIFE